MKLKCIIVDDEPLAIKLLESYVSKVDDIDLVGSFSNSVEALQFCNDNLVQAIFLDIQMPLLTGVQLSKLVGGVKVIFTTAYPDFAVQGFEVNAIDYLVKPITLERFLIAINRLRTSIIPPVNNEKLGYIFIKSEYKSIKVNYTDIIYLKGLGDYVDIRLVNGRLLTLEKLKHFEEVLPSHLFIRVHKSYIVSIQKIEYIEQGKLKINNQLIRISKLYFTEFKKRTGL